MKSSPDITDYDKFDYDYSKYWKTRNYEDLAEKHAFTHLIKNISGQWFLDLGGSYGRNLNIYKNNYESKIICDYSIKALKQARFIIEQNGIKQVYLVAANAYNLPFKSESIDGVGFIRVLHHMNKPRLAIKEISRVISKNGYLFLEFANKHNIKAIIRALLNLDFEYLKSKLPYKQKSMGSCEGSDKKTAGIIYNFNPNWVKGLLVSHEFGILDVINVSFLRIPFLKKIFTTNFLFSVEKILQDLLSWSNITPSIFLKSVKKSGTSNIYENIEDFLVCPKCKSALIINKSSIRCKRCKNNYRKNGGIYDLRYPKPTN